MKKSLSKITLYSSLLLIMLLVTALFIPCAAAQGIVLVNLPQCWGVFVGISNFQNFHALTVQFGDTSQTALYNSIASVWGTSHCRLLTNSEATKANILDAISWLATQANSNDTVLFSVRSNGAPGPGGDYYFYTYNSNLADWDNDISSQELSDAFDAVHADGSAFVLSFRHSGGFIPNLGGAGRVILASCQVGETGNWDAIIANDIFAHYVDNGLYDFAGADINHDYIMAAEEVFDYAAAATIQFNADHGNPAQHPVINDQYSGDLALISKFVFNTNISLPSGSTIVTINGLDYTSDTITVYSMPGRSHTVNVAAQVSGGTGTRYTFTNWNGGVTTTNQVVYSGLYTANFNKEYLLKINSSYGNPSGGGWYVDGTTASFSVTPLIETSNTKHTFNGWSGDFTGTAASGSIIMKAPKTITGSWHSEYLLTINSDYGTPAGAGWYDEGATVNISAEPTQGFIIRHIFDGWSGDLTSTSANASITMNAPKVITANWHADYMQLYIAIAIVVVVIIVIVLVVVLARRKGGTPRPPVTATPTYSPPPSAGPPSAPPPPAAGPSSTPPPPPAPR
jgi:uncharacterized repeat protein (TIGR02543 family)